MRLETDWSHHLGEGAAQQMFTEGAAEARLSPGNVSVGVPVFPAGLAHAGEEILSAEHLLSLLSAVRVVKMSIIVINFLIWVNCLGGVDNSVSAVVSSGGVGTARVIGQTEHRD